MIKPFFSVIIPTYNRKHFLEKCVRSVLSQTYPHFELIIIDDGSDDGTKELISSFKDDRIFYRYQNNQGVSRSRNRAICMAKSDFLAFLDSDDWWDTKKLEKSLENIRKYNEIKIFHTEEIWYSKGKLLHQKIKHKKPTGEFYKNALPLCCISISTAVVHKSVFEDIGMFDETFEACEDYDFWLRTANKYEVQLIKEPLTFKDGGRPDQLSFKTWGLDRFRIKALCKMLETGKLSDDNKRHTILELEKKCRIFAIGCRKRKRIKEADDYTLLAERYKNVI